MLSETASIDIINIYGINNVRTSTIHHSHDDDDWVRMWARSKSKSRRPFFHISICTMHTAQSRAVSASDCVLAYRMIYFNPVNRAFILHMNKTVSVTASRLSRNQNEKRYGALGSLFHSLFIPVYLPRSLDGVFCSWSRNELIFIIYDR